MNIPSVRNTMMQLHIGQYLLIISFSSGCFLTGHEGGRLLKPLCHYAIIFHDWENNALIVNAIHASSKQAGQYGYDWFSNVLRNILLGSSAQW
jgi:hypothetical protein